MLRYPVRMDTFLGEVSKPMMGRQRNECPAGMSPICLSPRGNMLHVAHISCSLVPPALVQMGPFPGFTFLLLMLVLPICHQNILKVSNVILLPEVFLTSPSRYEFLVPEIQQPGFAPLLWHCPWRALRW